MPGNFGALPNVGENIQMSQQNGVQPASMTLRQLIEQERIAGSDLSKVPLKDRLFSTITGMMKSDEAVIREIGLDLMRQYYETYK